MNTKLVLWQLCFNLMLSKIKLQPVRIRSFDQIRLNRERFNGASRSAFCSYSCELFRFGLLEYFLSVLLVSGIYLRLESCTIDFIVDFSRHIEIS